jgi:Tol biopolymer transport system component
MINADGSNRRTLTNAPGLDIDPTWSPDGSKIAFLSTRDGNGEIYVMDADGSNEFNLSNNTAEDQHPAWSPDSSQIAFASARDGNWEIYVMDSDGSNPVRLTNDPADDRHVLWSPDGLYIAFVSQRDPSDPAQMERGQNEYLYVINADGSNQIRLTDELGIPRKPAWSP